MAKYELGRRIWFLRVPLAAAALSSIISGAQSGPDPLAGVSHSSTLTFIEQDGSCLRGIIVTSDTTSVTVEPFRQPSRTLQRDSLSQISQGNALLFSARSSWRDVRTLRLYPREALVITTKSGKSVKGTVIAATADSITLKHGFNTAVFPKAEVRTVDYLRTRPATDDFNLALEEAPWALFMYPELYGRLVGLEGRIPVRLYDASKPEDDRATGIKYCPNS